MEEERKESIEQERNESVEQETKEGEVKEGPEKKKKSWTDFFLVPLAIVFVLMLAGSIVGELLCLVRRAVMSELTPFWEIFDMYFSFIGIWIITLLYLFLTKKNKPILKAIGTEMKGNNVKLLLLGLLIGFVTNGICILVAWLHGDIYLYFDSFPVIKILVLFVVVFIQSSAEELLCRGVLYQRLRKGYKHPAVAIIGNAVLFSALHLGNPGVTPLALLNIVVVGIMFSLMVYYFDSIWCAMAAHAMWNFNQNIIFGLPNSGAVSPVSILKLDATTAVDSFAYNVGFGVEGTILACIVLTIGSLLIWWIGKQKGMKPTEVFFS